MKIGTLTIKLLTWDDFKSEPIPNSQWKAHTYWCVGYTFDIKMRKMKKSNNIKLEYVNIVRYRLSMNTWAQLSDRCWVRNKWPRLLEHETGHYIIGCLCALEFKKRYF